jgi:hypothetical protein
MESMIGVGVVAHETPSSMAFESVERTDAELARIARSAGILRLGLADGLEELAHAGGHHELGFPTIESYALERCERSARWVQESRALSRRLRELPAVRHSLVLGKISFSMAQVIAKVARADDEESWLSEAQGQSVRAMRQLVKKRTEGERTEGERTEGEAGSPGQLSAGAQDDKVTLTVTANREDAWLFESARMIVKRVGGGTVEETLEALLAEGATTLLPQIDRESRPLFDAELDERATQRAWEKELGRFREEAEVRCEPVVQSRHGADRSTEPDIPSGAAASERNWNGDARYIDRELRRVSAELVRRELLLGGGPR